MPTRLPSTPHDASQSAMFGYRLTPAPDDCKISIIGSLLIRETLDARAPAACAQIIAITDSLPVRSGGAAVRKAVRTTLKACSPAGATYRILHHASRADVNLQVADYCAWAAYRKWERADDRSYRIMTDAGVAWVEARLVHAG